MDHETDTQPMTWQEQTDERLDAIREELRGINDRLGLMLEILVPERDDGPTLDDLLAKIVTLIIERRPVCEPAWKIAPGGGVIGTEN